MPTTGDKNKEAATNPTSTGQARPGGPAAGAATEIARHYGDHGQPATPSAGPAPQDAASQQSGQTRSDASGIGEAANRAAEQAGSALSQAGETAQNLANRAREQAGPAMQAAYDQGARAGEYVTRNVHEYPATALLIAAAVGYGLAYLLHGGSRR